MHEVPERALPDTVYIVAPVPEERGRMRDALSGEAYEFRPFDSAEALLSSLVGNECGCVVAPVDLGGMGVRRLIESLRSRKLCLPVVVVGREDDLRLAVDLVRAGAAEFVEHPPSPRRLQTAVRRALAAARVARAHSG